MAKIILKITVIGSHTIHKDTDNITTRSREQLELFLAPTRGIELWQTSRDVLPHLELVLHQLYPITQSNHTFIGLNLCGEECYVDNQMW